jgi:hypothetical protein
MSVRKAMRRPSGLKLGKYAARLLKYREIEYVSSPTIHFLFTCASSS